MAAADAQLNLLDRAIAVLAPQLGLKRLAARIQLAQYEAAKPSRQRKFRKTAGAPDTLVGTSAKALRDQIRYLERNHDIARGALNTLVNNIVGPDGIGVEFQPRRKGGSIHDEYALALTEAFRDWQRRPEVTWQHNWSACQRMAGRTWLRDGEVFTQELFGPVQKLDHGTRVPYSLELIEPDLLPLDFDDTSRGIRQSVERSEWGRAMAYHVFKKNPEEVGQLRGTQDMKRIPAERMLHLALRDRIGQLRGVSAFASVITRLEDIKDYEESERVAAKVAAMLTAYVKRNSPDGYDPAGMERDEDGNLKPRDLAMSPGLIIDSLAVGEEIGLINSDRPNPNLVTFRAGQLRAAAAGIGISFSSLARDYNGTYSAQRQELVEQYVHYAVLTDLFASAQVLPVIERFISIADMSGVVPMPTDLKPGTWNDVLLVAPSMPWIDPLKEMTAWVMAVQAGFASEYEVLRKRGVNPHDLLEQVTQFRKKARERELVFSSDAANKSAGGGSQAASAPTDPTTA